MAPLDLRTDALLETNPHMSQSQAVEYIQNIDQERLRWSRLMYGLDVSDPANYDLTVNLKRLTLESACATIAEAASQPRYQITDEVETEIFAFADSRFSSSGGWKRTVSGPLSQVVTCAHRPRSRR